MKCKRCEEQDAIHSLVYKPAPGKPPIAGAICCWCKVRLGYAPTGDHMCTIANRALRDDPSLDLSGEVYSLSTQNRFKQLEVEEMNRKIEEWYKDGPNISTDSASRMWTWTSGTVGTVEYNYPFQYNYTINPAPQAQNRRIVIDELARIGDEVRRQRVENIPIARYPQRGMHVWDEMRLAGEAPPDEERAEGRNG